MAGICAYGAYVPRYRLKRETVFKAMGWINPASGALAKGEKAVANFDEDSITMAVAAGLDCLGAIDRRQIEGLFFASTTMPYKERLNAGIVGAAMGLEEDIRAGDCSGGLRAGTTALVNALDIVESGRLNKVMVCSADTRLGKPGSAQEMLFGDAGASFLVGNDHPIAEYKGGYSMTCDFVDHYRGAHSRYDRQGEDRWIRDMGYRQLIPSAVNGFLHKYQMTIKDFAKIIYPCHYQAERKSLNRLLGLDDQAVQPDLMERIGDTGVAHPLIMLADALESAVAGDKILVLGFGNGCDVLCFEVTDHIADFKRPLGVSGCLSTGAPLTRYEKYLVWRDILPGDLGTRSEVDQWTRWSVNWRNRKAFMGLWGSKCTSCETVHFPPQRMCVNPECGKTDEMTDILFSDKGGTIFSYTGDNLAASFDPPAIYGSVEFDIGGRCMFDFTDCELESLFVGMPVSMTFRRKYLDEKRDIAGYFWKAIPRREVSIDGDRD